MAYPTPQRVSSLIAAQANLATAKTAIDALSAGNPKIADQQLFKAVANLIEAIQQTFLDDGQSSVPATPDVI